MRTTQFLIILIALTYSLPKLQAQQSVADVRPKSVSVEEMIGGKRQFLQLLVNKVLPEKKRIGMLSLTAYATDYRGITVNTEFQNTTLIYHHLFKGISINSGSNFTSVEGLTNFVGLQYIYQDKKWLVIYIPSYYFINSHKVSNLALLEYTPEINKNWSVYSRVQVLYNHDLESGTHFRSYVYSRLGLTYRYFSFGLAHNIDRYASNKGAKNNYGVFLKFSL